MHEELSHHNISDLITTVCGHVLNVDTCLCKLWVAGKGAAWNRHLSCMFLGCKCVTCPKSDELSCARRGCLLCTGTVQLLSAFNPWRGRAFLMRVWEHISSTVLCLVPLWGRCEGLNSKLAWRLNAFRTEKGQVSSWERPCYPSARLVGCLLSGEGMGSGAIITEIS